MKKQLIRLTENDLHRIIENTVGDILNERHVMRLPNQTPPPSDMPPMGGEQPPMDAPNPMGGEPPMGDDMPPMGGDMPPMSDGDGSNGVNQELLDVISQLGLEDQNAVLKYAKSMTDNEDNQGMQNGGGQTPMENRDRSNAIVSEIIQGFFDNKKEKVRDTNKEITNNKINGKNPFITNR